MRDDPEEPSGLPDEEAEIPPLGPPAGEDADSDVGGRGRDGEELPGLPTSEPDTAG